MAVPGDLPELWITGHSLGGAAAKALFYHFLLEDPTTLATLLHTPDAASALQRTWLFTYGCPSVLYAGATVNPDAVATEQAVAAFIQAKAREYRYELPFPRPH